MPFLMCYYKLIIGFIHFWNFHLTCYDFCCFLLIISRSRSLFCEWSWHIISSVFKKDANRTLVCVHQTCLIYILISCFVIRMTECWSKCRGTVIKFFLILGLGLSFYTCKYYMLLTNYSYVEYVGSTFAISMYIVVQLLLLK